MRRATLGELAAGYGMPVPEVRGFGSFGAFAAMYLAACRVLRTPADLRRLVDELVGDAAAAGAAWVEPSFYPPNHNERLGPSEAVVEIVLDELAASAARHGVGAGLMLAADRTADPAPAVAQARLAARYRDEGVVAFGLVNDEAGFPPEVFADAYTLVRDAGLLRPPTPASWPVRRAWWGPSRPSVPTGCSTGSGPWRIRRWSSTWPSAVSASTSARPRTSCSASIPPSKTTRCPPSSMPVCAAASTGTTRCSSGPTWPRSTSCSGPPSASTTGASPTWPGARSTPPALPRHSRSSPARHRGVARLTALPSSEGCAWVHGCRRRSSETRAAGPDRRGRRRLGIPGPSTVACPGTPRRRSSTPRPSPPSSASGASG